MRDCLILAVHVLVTVAKLLRPGGVRAVVAESLLMKHQLLITARSRRRAPKLTTTDRIIIGLTSLFVRPPDPEAIGNSQTGYLVQVP